MFSAVTDAKIIAVGDDWQSIYAFSGSDITLFTKFESTMGYAKLLKIVKTYRNSQEVIDIAGNFIQRNKEQISKKLISPKTIDDPVIIYTYDSSRKKTNEDRHTGTNYAIAHAVETVLGEIIKYSEKDKKSVGSILLLGRFGFDGDHLEKTGLFEYIRRTKKLKSVKYPKLDITFMTAHASKGLGYDNVILINGRNETYGFPSKIEDDPVLSFVIRGDRSIDYAEERRLFYVAMTRTKNRVFCIAPKQNPSEFLLEIKRDYKNVILQGSWNEDEPKNIRRKSCPICGFPLQFRCKNAYGLNLHMCVNEPELCGFMTNELKAGKMSILKCNSCRDGYLVAKPGKETGYFLGCTNYKENGTGCNNKISKQQYYKNMGYALEELSNPIEIEKNKKVEKKKEVKKVSSSETLENEKEIFKGNISGVMYQSYDLSEIIYTILMTLQHVNAKKFYGITTLLDVLRGSRSVKMKKTTLETIPEYGVLKDIPREKLTIIIEWLLENHFILKTKGKYPVLHITDKGNEYHIFLTAGKLKTLKKELEEDFKKYN